MDYYEGTITKGRAYYQAIVTKGLLRRIFTEGPLLRDYYKGALATGDHC